LLLESLLELTTAAAACSSTCADRTNQNAHTILYHGTAVYYIEPTYYYYYVVYCEGEAFRKAVSVEVVLLSLVVKVLYRIYVWPKLSMRALRVMHGSRNAYRETLAEGQVQIYRPGRGKM
jgi:hypothetical protein